MLQRRLHFLLQLNTNNLFTTSLRRWFLIVGLTLLLVFVTFCAPAPSGLRKLAESPIAPISSQFRISTATPESQTSVPVLAYYYIWFDVQSWNRAKSDYPLLGRYSSDDTDVMRQHVRWAKDSGIDGFIVSWKSTQKMNRRLEKLVKIAGEENFKLAINYESLDFSRNPLPVEYVDTDLRYLIQHYGEHPVFDLFGKSMVIWSGTWKFSVQDIKAVVQDKREHLLILASEKSVKDYERLSGFVDGDAYYWSSVDPETHPGYLEKLIAMGEAIHKDGGIWIAPAAPGFDARLVGGEGVVDRKEGDTLRTELNVGLQSLPDGIGLISWNEFSENSHIEPSEKHGHRYLEIITEMLPLAPPPVDFDSSIQNNSKE